MRSDVISIDSKGYGFTDAVEHTKKVAAYKGLRKKDSVRLQMLTEELLSLARSITGEMNASFWIDFEGDQADLHMTTHTILDKEKREQLISSSSSRKNEAANTFLGKLRDIFEEAMTADPEQCEVPDDLIDDLPHSVFGKPEWDGYERSILAELADDVKVSIRGTVVDVTVSKSFA